jgi:hypothetical protein
MNRFDSMSGCCFAHPDHNDHEVFGPHGHLCRGPIGAEWPANWPMDRDPRDSFAWPHRGARAGLSWFLGTGSHRSRPDGQVAPGGGARPSGAEGVFCAGCRNRCQAGRVHSTRPAQPGR